MITEIKDIIQEKYYRKPSSPEFIILEERDTKGKLIPKQKNYTYNDISFCLFKLPDDGDKVHPLLKEKISGLKKVPDYIIFCEKKNKKYVLVFELKSDETGDFELQLKAGDAIAKYFIGMFELYKGKIFNDIEYRFICYSNKKWKNPTAKYNYGALHKDFKYYLNTRKYSEFGEGLNMLINKSKSK